jgi:hypothetical protein
MKVPKLTDMILNKDFLEEAKKYKFFKDDADTEPVEIDAEDDDDAEEKIKKITGKDPKKITKWSDVNEDNTTSNLDGGLGQPRTPFAFRKKVKKPNDDIYTESRSAGILEVAYKDWASDDSLSNKQKINKEISEVSKKLFEIDRMITRTSKFKNEIGADSTIFWKETCSKFNKINERLLKISSKLREFNK